MTLVLGPPCGLGLAFLSPVPESGTFPGECAAEQAVPCPMLF